MANVVHNGCVSRFRFVSDAFADQVDGSQAEVGNRLGEYTKPTDDDWPLQIVYTGHFLDVTIVINIIFIKYKQNNDGTQFWKIPMVLSGD